MDKVRLVTAANPHTDLCPVVPFRIRVQDVLHGLLQAGETQVTLWRYAQALSEQTLQASNSHSEVLRHLANIRLPTFSPALNRTDCGKEPPAGIARRLVQQAAK